MNIEAIAMLRIPNAKLQLLLRMAKTLIREAPSAQNAPVAAALAKLDAHVALVDDALSRRIRAKNPRLLARELEFDRAVDTLWIFLREQLASFAQAFGHPGLGLLSAERQAAIGLDDLRELAILSRSVHEQLFMANGTNFVKFSLSAQAEEMAALLRIIEEDKLGDDIESVFDDRILDTIIVCQAEYEELVNDRMNREAGESGDFRQLRRRLRWLVGRYKLALETLYDEDEPQTEEIIFAALRPLVTVNALVSRSNTATIDLDAELVQTPEYDALEDDDEASGVGSEDDSMPSQAANLEVSADHV